MSTSTITLDQLRDRQIVAEDLLHTVQAAPDVRRTAVTAASTPLSVFGSKLSGHER